MNSSFVRKPDLVPEEQSLKASETLVLTGSFLTAEIEHNSTLVTKSSFDVRDRIEAVQEVVDTINQACDSLHSATINLSDSTPHFDTDALLNQAQGTFDSAAKPLLGMDINSLLNHLQRVKKHAAELSFIAVMTQIDAVGKSDDNASTSDFANGLTKLVVTLKETTRSDAVSAQPIGKTASTAQKNPNVCRHCPDQTGR